LMPKGINIMGVIGKKWESRSITGLLGGRTKVTMKG
jgi:hypothetical protein